jgi:hypothetical protein
MISLCELLRFAVVASINKGRSLLMPDTGTGMVRVDFGFLESNFHARIQPDRNDTAMNRK